ncbi:cation-transporting ATPase 4 [Cadophora sp. MPI-SDFR-AT-0126]|nr:cation-transporting ATPase 4 [Leotiomycetes sp. MPI-SDFR-AT-0126]
MAVENRGLELAAVIIFLMVFSLVTVGLRCYTMGFVLKRFFAEDWLSVVTLAVYMFYSISALISIRWGLGQHVADVPIDQHPFALFWKYIGQCIYVLISVLVKYIAGLLLLRICSRQKWQRITIWTLLGVVTVFNMFYIFIVIFQCMPVQFYWYRYSPNPPITGKCNHSKLATIPTYVSLFLNVLSDWILALLPISVVWNSNMDRNTKISVVAVLAIGSIASLATVARIPYAKQLLSNPDYLYNFTDLAIWSTVEIGLALSASSLATLKPLFRKLNILVSTRNGSRLGIGTSGLGTSGRGTKDGGDSAWHSRKRSTPFTPRNFTEIKDEENELGVLQRSAEKSVLDASAGDSLISVPLASHPPSQPPRHDFNNSTFS